MSVTLERDKIAKLAETEGIKKLRDNNQEINERIFKEKGIDHMIFILAGLCSFNVTVGRESETYYGILNLKNFVLEKYNSLADAKKQKHKAYLDEVLEEVDEELQYLRETYL